MLSSFTAIADPTVPGSVAILSTTDGTVIARHFVAQGTPASVLLMTDAAPSTPDATVAIVAPTTAGSSWGHNHPVVRRALVDSAADSSDLPAASTTASTNWPICSTVFGGSAVGAVVSVRAPASTVAAAAAAQPTPSSRLAAFLAMRSRANQAPDAAAAGGASASGQPPLVTSFAVATSMNTPTVALLQLRGGVLVPIAHVSIPEGSRLLSIADAAFDGTRIAALVVFVSVATGDAVPAIVTFTAANDVAATVSVLALPEAVSAVVRAPGDVRAVALGPITADGGAMAWIATSAANGAIAALRLEDVTSAVCAVRRAGIFGRTANNGSGQQRRPMIFTGVSAAGYVPPRTLDLAGPGPLTLAPHPTNAACVISSPTSTVALALAVTTWSDDVASTTLAHEPFLAGTGESAGVAAATLFTPSAAQRHALGAVALRFVTCGVTSAACGVMTCGVECFCQPCPAVLSSGVAVAASANQANADAANASDLSTLPQRVMRAATSDALFACREATTDAVAKLEKDTDAALLAGPAAGAAAVAELRTVLRTLHATAAVFAARAGTAAAAGQTGASTGAVFDVWLQRLQVCALRLDTIELLASASAPAAVPVSSFATMRATHEAVAAEAAKFVSQELQLIGASAQHHGDGDSRADAAHDAALWAPGPLCVEVVAAAVPGLDARAMIESPITALAAAITATFAPRAGARGGADSSVAWLAMAILYAAAARGVGAEACSSFAHAMGLPAASVALAALASRVDTAGGVAALANGDETVMHRATADVLTVAACGSPQARALAPLIFCRAVDGGWYDAALAISSAVLAPALAARTATGSSGAQMAPQVWPNSVLLRAAFLMAQSGDREALHALLVATRPAVGAPHLGAARRLRSYVLAAAVSASGVRGSCLGLFECGALAQSLAYVASGSSPAAASADAAGASLSHSAVMNGQENDDDENEEVLALMGRLPPNVRPVVEAEFLISQHHYAEAHDVVANMVPTTPEAAQWAAALSSWLVALTGAS